jgi:SAM-dependent methyltransferase
VAPGEFALGAGASLVRESLDDVAPTWHCDLRGFRYRRLDLQSTGAKTSRDGTSATQREDARSGSGLGSRIDALYANRFPDAERQQKARLWQVLCASFFSKYVSGTDVVLDVGAGYCDFINHIPGGRRIAVDINPDTKRYAASGIEVHGVDLSEIHRALAPGSVDFAFASNVFEHLRGPDDLLAVLDSIRAVLKPGGRLMIMQPNVRHVGPAFWDFFDHTLPLTEKGMVEALQVARFHVREVRSRFLPHTTKSMLPQWSWLVRAYLAAAPVQWLLGKQMLVLAEKL